MPLPDAEDPKTSNLYSQLRSSQAGSVTQTDYDLVKDPVFINSEWEDEARRLKLWGELSGKSSASGPMPGTGQIKTASCTVSSVDVTAFTPEAGEAWQVVGISGAAAGSLTTLSGVTLYVKLSSSVIIVEWSGSGSIEPPDNQYNTPLIFDSNLPLIGRIYKSGGLGAGEQVDIAFAMIRIR